MNNGLKDALERQERRRIRWFRTFILLFVLNFAFICANTWMRLYTDTHTALGISALVIGIVATICCAIGAIKESKPS